MADDEIRFNPSGSITLVVDGKTYRMRRPTLKTYRYFSERLQDLGDDIKAHAKALTRLREQIDGTPDGKALDKLEAEARELNRPMSDWTIPIVAEMLNHCEPPFELAEDDWPAWMANSQLPSDIVAHWRNVPKASGPAATT